MAEFPAFANRADAYLDLARVLRVGVGMPAPRIDIAADLAHDFLPRGFLLTSLAAFSPAAFALPWLPHPRPACLRRCPTAFR